VSSDLVDPVQAPPPWNIARSSFYSLLIGVAFLATQIAVMTIMLTVRVINDPELDVEAWFEHAASDGLLLSISTLSSAFLCIPLVKFLTGRRESRAWDFIGLIPTDLRTIATWSLGMIAFVIVSDLITVAIGRPIVPEFSAEAYASSEYPVLLFAALAFAAPAFEEVFFRGFILGTLKSSGVSVFFAALVSSIAWSAIHLQYESYTLVTLFFMGMLLAAARIKNGSLIPCLVMHGLANVIAFFEATLLTKPGAV
jgi:membrane protease YdiL (CAAX protease family)